MQNQRGLHLLPIVLETGISKNQKPRTPGAENCLRSRLCTSIYAPNETKENKKKNEL